MSLTRIRVQDSDSDSDLIVPVKKKVKDQVEDLKKIIKMNSSARKRRENYDNLSLKISNSLEKVQIQRAVKIQKPDFLDEDLTIEYLKTNVLMALVKTGKIKRNYDNFKWLMHVLIKSQEWKSKVVQVIVEFLQEFSREKRWEMISGYLNSQQVIELVKELDKDLEIYKQLLKLSSQKCFLTAFVEFAQIFEDLIQDLDQETAIELFCEFEDPGSVINVLKVLNHLNMDQILKKTAKKYLSKFYKLENDNEYLDFVQRLLTVHEDYEKDLVILYLVKACLNISDLDSKQKTEWLRWIKTKSRLQRSLTNEHIEILNFLNGWRFVFEE